MSFLSKLFGWSRKRAAEQALTEAQVADIQASFAKVLPISATAAEIFYTRLFEIAPDTRALFKGAPGSPEMAEQGKKLMGTLAIVVNGLKDFDSIAPTAAALAKRHVEYGVKPEHYESVGTALLITLKEGLGEAFTPSVEAAWIAAYNALSGAMIDAAYPGRRSAAA